jgi:hypothetical protein
MTFMAAEPRPASFVDAKVPSVGFLSLHKLLSTALPGSTEAAPDATIPELVLPVPEDGGRCLPGAPVAFRENSTDFYADTTRLAAWCRQRRYPEPVCAEIHKYFSEEGVLVRSMLSVALPGGATDPIAVLNLHRQRPGMFDAGRSASEFVEIAEPLFRLLHEEIARWVQRTQTV